MPRSAFARSRAAASMRRKQNSAVTAEVEPARVLLTGTLRALQAARSRLAERSPVSAMNFSFGRRSMSARGNGVRSRMSTSTSKGASFAAASSWEAKAWWKTETSRPRRRSRSQSADLSASFW